MTFATLTASNPFRPMNSLDMEISLQGKIERGASTISAEKKLDQRVYWVYQTYGTNLSLFFKSVCAQAHKDTDKLEAKTDVRFLKSR